MPTEADNQCGEGEKCVPSDTEDCVEGEDKVTPPKDEVTPPKDEVTPPKDAEATPPGSVRPPVVAGVETVAQPPGAVPQAVTPPAVVQPSAGVLPNTGTPAFVRLVGLVGLAFLGLGAAAMRWRRGTES